MLKKIVSSLVLYTFCILSIVILLDWILVTPDVHVSHSTGNCVGVTTYDGVFFDSLGYNCENMPEKYNHVWVK